MSKRDFIHVAVREALENEGWEITDDPFLIDLKFEETSFKVDIGAQKLISATKGAKEIAVEIKTLGEMSVINAFHTVLGQYLNYRDALELSEDSAELFLGVSKEGYKKLYDSPFIKMQLVRYSIKIVIINIATKKITRWVN